MNDLDVSIIDNWPYFDLIVKLPDGQILRDRAIWHIAATQFAPKIQTAFEKAINKLVDRNKRARGVSEPNQRA